MTRLQLAKIRQDVYFLKGRRRTLERIAMGPYTMAAASLIKRKFRSGRIAYYLSIPTPQNSWHKYVSKNKLELYRRRTDAWREFVHAMAEWVQVNKDIERNLRKLGKGRCEKLEIRRKEKK